MKRKPEWERHNLGALVDVLDSRRVPLSAQERALRPGDVPYYGATGQVGWIDEALFDESLILLGEDGVQFFDRDKPKAYPITGRSWVNNHAHVLRPRIDLIDQRFLLHYLNWFDYGGYANGTTRLKLTQSAMRQIPVLLPQLDEQEHIVEILEDHLSRLDVGGLGLEHAARRIDILETQTVRAALTGRADVGPHDVQIRGASLDDGELAPLPRGWSWMRLGEIADVVGGITKDSSKQSESGFIEVPYLRVANVQRGHLDLKTITSIRVPPRKVETLRLLQGDVLLNEGGDRDKLGRGWVWEGQIEICIHQNHVFRARIRDGKLDPYLLSWAANSIGGRWCERNGKQSVNLASISLSKIRLMPVPVPPLNEQAALRQHIEAVVDGCRIMRSEITTSRNRSVALRRSLLTAAFAGRLTCSTPGIEMVKEMTGV